MVIYNVTSNSHNDILDLLSDAYSLMANVSDCDRSAVNRLFSLKIEIKGQRRESNTSQRVNTVGSSPPLHGFPPLSPVLFEFSVISGNIEGR